MKTTKDIDGKKIVHSNISNTGHQHFDNFSSGYYLSTLKTEKDIRAKFERTKFSLKRGHDPILHIDAQESDFVVKVEPLGSTNGNDTREIQLHLENTCSQDALLGIHSIPC